MGKQPHRRCLPWLFKRALPIHPLPLAELSPLLGPMPIGGPVKYSLQKPMNQMVHLLNTTPLLPSLLMSNMTMWIFFQHQNQLLKHLEISLQQLNPRDSLLIALTMRVLLHWLRIQRMLLYFLMAFRKVQIFTSTRLS